MRKGIRKRCLAVALSMVLTFVDNAPALAKESGFLENESIVAAEEEALSEDDILNRMTEEEEIEEQESEQEMSEKDSDKNQTIENKETESSFDENIATSETESTEENKSEYLTETSEENIEKSSQEEAGSSESETSEEWNSTEETTGIEETAGTEETTDTEETTETESIENDSSEKEESIIVPEFNVTGSNSLGKMLAEALAAETTEIEKNAGYNVFSIEIKNKQAIVTYETLKEATIVVGIYDEAGTKLLGTGKSEVKSDETTTSVMIDMNSMPSYFYLRGFLIDTESLRPLCTVYESPMYTREMQEFLKKTTDDFDRDKVVNFDNDITNNFVVAADDTIMIPQNDEGKNQLISIDYDTQTYVIANADDSITSLAAGEIFIYEYEEGELLIVKISEISIGKEGTTVTITGEETSLEEVFSYVKFDTEAGMDNVEIDDSTCDEGITYEGLIQDGDAQTRAVEGEGSASAKAAFDIDKEYKQEDDAGEGSVSFKVSGGINLELKASIKIYISFKIQYLEIKMDYSAKLEVKTSGKGELKVKLAQFGFSPVAGVYIEIVPTWFCEVSGSIDFSVTIKGTVGFRVSSNEGIKNLTSSPTIKSEFKIEATIYTGFSLEPKLAIIHDKIAKVTLEANIGGEIKASSKYTIESKADKRHDCKDCLDGDISVKCKISAGAKLLNWDKLTFTLKWEMDDKVADFYYSSDYNDWGFTECPHYSYRVKISVQDADKSPIYGATVQCTGNDEEKEVVTDKKGNAILYLHQGDWSINVVMQGYTDKVKKISIANKAIEVKLVMGVGEIEGNEIKELSLGNWHSGAIIEDGSLYMWGDNDSGEIGDGTTITYYEPKKIMENVKAVSLGGSHSGAITEEGTLYMWGDNLLGDIGDGTHDRCYEPKKIMENVKTVSLGSSHSGVITEDGTLYMWGNNLDGEIGDGTTTDCYQPKKIMENVRTVSLGYGYSGAITEDGFIYMWGANHSGRLGDGTRNDSHVPIKITIPDDTTSKSHSLSGRSSNDIASISDTWTNRVMKFSAILNNTAVSGNASFTDLTPEETYNIYEIKDAETENILSTSNLLYIGQSDADSNGSISITYEPREACDSSVIFAVANTPVSIRGTSISVSDVYADGTVKMPDVSVYYNGYELEEGTDYELSGQYSATETGDYTLTVEGIGIFGDKKDVVWHITENSSAKLEMPTPSIISGSVVQAGTKLILTSENDALVYYTMDGTNPTNKSILYTEPITISKSVTIKAIAIKENFNDSEIAIFTYTVNADDKKIPLPTASIASGSAVQKGTAVELLCFTEDAVIHYTVDGTVPTTDSLIYSKPIVLNTDMTIQAIAVKEGYENSDIATFVYKIAQGQYYTVTFNSNGGTYISTQTVQEHGKASEPTIPIKEGYIFNGWYLNGVLYDFDTEVTSDIILEAGWKSKDDNKDDSNKDDDNKDDDNKDDDNKDDDNKDDNNDKDDDNSKDDSSYPAAERQDLSALNASITGIRPQTYNRDEQEPVVKVTAFVNGRKTTLIEGMEYRVSYKNNIDAGTATITIKGNGAYKGTLTQNFTIRPKSLKKLKVVVGALSENASGSDLLSYPIHVYDGAKRLNLGTDYTLFGAGMTKNAAKVSIIGKGNYTGTMTAKLSVYNVSSDRIIKPDNVRLDKDTASYTGKPVKTVNPIVTVNGSTLTLNQDYKVQYQNNTNAGTAYVIVIGKGAYRGRVVLPFQIQPVVSAGALTIKHIPAKTYNGKLQKPAVSVTASTNGRTKKLVNNKDYKVTYKNNFHAGTATVMIIGKGNYAGVKAQTQFTIQPQSIAKAAVKGAQSSLQLTYNKRLLKQGIHYEAPSCGGSTKNKVQVTIKGKGDFTGQITKYIKK